MIHPSCRRVGGKWTTYKLLPRDGVAHIIGVPSTKPQRWTCLKPAEAAAEAAAEAPNPHSHGGKFPIVRFRVIALPGSGTRSLSLVKSYRRDRALER